MNIKPFFARFLDAQKTVATTNLAPAKNAKEPITMHTLKFPSDNDTFDPTNHGYAVKLRREALPELPYAVKLRREALHLSESPLKEANTGNCNKPGNVVTLAYPSDSDVMEGRLRF